MQTVQTRHITLCSEKSVVTVSLWTVSCSATLHFCGVLPSPTRLVLQGGSAVSPQVRVTSHLASVDCSPSSKLDKWVAAVWPLSASKVRPMGSRDLLPSGKYIYGMDVSYTFQQADGGAVKPTWPGLNKVLYESAFVAQFYTIFGKFKYSLCSSLVFILYLHALSG